MKTPYLLPVLFLVFCGNAFSDTMVITMKNGA
jgi:hypothetical protein